MSLPTTYKALISYGKEKGPQIEELPLPTPSQNQILVQMAFAPINPSDIMSLNGTYNIPLNPPYPVGLEGAGTVVAVGENLTVPHKVGDRVHVIGLGTIGQYLLADSDKCRKIQENLSFEEAAAHFANPVTVVAMSEYAKKNGHKAVIHTAGSSALGRMLIRYFKHKGIKTINIVRKDEFIEELKKDGADYVLNSQAPDFEAQLKEIAHQEEATLAFDSIAGDLTAKIIRNQPEDSTVAIYGSLGGSDLSALDANKLVFEGKTLTGFYINKYLKKAAQTGEIVKLMEEVYELLPTVLSSNIQKVFKLDDIKEAIAFYEKNSSKGKILIKSN